MLKLLRYFLIKRRVNNPLLAARIYQMIYHPEMSHIWLGQSKDNRLSSKDFGLLGNSQKVSEKIQKTPQLKTQKQKLEETLNNLRNIPEKTNFHKNAIEMLEASIRNMR